MISLFSEWLCNPSLGELCPKLNRRALQIIRMKGRPRHNIFYIPGPVATRMDAPRSNPAHLHTQLHPRDPTLSPSPALYGSSALGSETQRARGEYSSRRAGVARSLVHSQCAHFTRYIPQREKGRPASTHCFCCCWMRCPLWTKWQKNTNPRVSPGLW